MKVLVLEDNSVRTEFFQTVLPEIHKNHDIFYVDCVDDAKAIFRMEGKFDVYRLDHDLGGLEYVNTDEYETGSTFATFLVENGVNGLNEEIIIHSWNMKGAENMESIFEKSTKVPFNHHLLKEESKYIQGE